MIKAVHWIDSPTSEVLFSYLGYIHILLHHSLIELNQRYFVLFTTQFETSFSLLFVVRWSLSLFYRYYYGRYSSELNACVPTPLRHSQTTRQAISMDRRSVVLSNPRIGSFGVFLSICFLYLEFPSFICVSHQLQ